MTKVINYKKVYENETIKQKKAIEKMFELAKKYKIEKDFVTSKEELILQGKK
jgi:hypothetical protein